MADDAGRLQALEAEVARLRARETTLSADLDACRRELAEAQEQQAAAADVLRVIASSTSDLGQVLAGLTATAVRVCGADAGSLYKAEGAELVALASTHPSLVRQRQPFAGTLTARALEEARTVRIHGSAQSQLARYPESGGAILGVGAQVSSPLMQSGRAIGAFTVARLTSDPFTSEQIALLETFADQAVIAIENARLFEELEQRNADLQASNRQVTEALEQQTATAEVLRVIASSPTELQPVLDAVCQSAGRLSRSSTVVLGIREGDLLRAVATAGLVRAVPVGNSGSIDLR